VAHCLLSIAQQQISLIRNYMYKNIFALIIALFGGIASAVAIPSSLSVDFMTPGWVTGDTTETVDNVTVTAVYPPGSTLTASSSLGIGINAPSAIAGTIDLLNVTFGLQSGNGLTGAWVTNVGLLEGGELVLDTTKGDLTYTFTGAEASSGDYFISFGGALDVLAAQFYTVDATSILGTPDYSVAGFTSVPDGGTTLTLLGIGLLGLVVFRRKFAF
jgi:hypothetical protein